MRNTICISALLLAAAAAAAQDGPAPGCFMRDYSAAHLAAHPDQVVHTMWLRIYDHTFEGVRSRFAHMVVQFADQGHVKRAGIGALRLDQGLVCFDDSDGRPGCAVECDGGWFTVTAQDAGSITIATERLGVGDTESCGGAVDLAEIPMQEVKYRLDKVDEAQCLAQMRD